jgi:hypothetical protein
MGHKWARASPPTSACPTGVCPQCPPWGIRSRARGSTRKPPRRTSTVARNLGWCANSSRPGALHCRLPLVPTPLALLLALLHMDPLSHMQGHACTTKKSVRPDGALGILPLACHDRRNCMDKPRACMLEVCIQRGRRVRQQPRYACGLPGGARAALEAVAGTVPASWNANTAFLRGNVLVLRLASPSVHQ